MARNFVTVVAHTRGMPKRARKAIKKTPASSSSFTGLRPITRSSSKKSRKSLRDLYSSAK